ncbi:S41 family peptidase [Dethiothermospora halolimnae]|uniref:S41 family peptidase n=1 Tax=Dethiothermospora halolimnae TaxID=3114390 RepID=UPI003CCC078C
MVSKKKFLIGIIIAILITSLGTLAVISVVPVKLGDKYSLTEEKYEELVYMNNKYYKMEELSDHIQENYLRDIDEDKLYEWALKGMFASLGDPYSSYMTKKEFKDFMEDTEGSFVGIGVRITAGEDNLITVVAPIEDSPGEAAGIKTGDKIVKVDGKEFTAEQMDDAVSVMKGEPGTEVTVTILRKQENGDEKLIDFNIIREEIRVKSVKSAIIDNNIGYIRIATFDRKTSQDFSNHLSKLQEKDIKGLILDLRNNPGGLLDQCAEIADKLIGESTIVYTQTKNKKREYIKSDKSKIDIPLTILINGGSASASEILAGAVKDTESGTLIGTKTFGKGIVQRITPLMDGSGFKLTVSEYFTPSGKNIHGIGIAPNIVIKLAEGVEKFGTDNIKKDNQLQKAIEVINEKTK